MNTNYENNEVNVEITSKQEEFASRKFKHFDVIIYIACLLIAFSVWCYASYLDDPIIRQEVTLNLVLENGDWGDYISTPKLTIVIYGEESLLSGISELTIKIDRSEFEDYNVDTVIDLVLPNGVNSHEKQITLQLNTSK